MSLMTLVCLIGATAALVIGGLLIAMAVSQPSKMPRRIGLDALLVIVGAIYVSDGIALIIQAFRGRT